MTPALLGRYRTPRFRYGAVVRCEARGEVEIVGLTAAPIPWPVGQKGRAKMLVITGDLARAIRRESAAAVCHWWGVTPQTVSKWRGLLGVGQFTPGTVREKSRSARASEGIARALEKAHAKNADPKRRAKIAAAKAGKPRPPHVAAMLRRLWKGKKHTAESLAKIKAGWEPVGATADAKPWTPEEDAMILAGRPTAEVAAKTGRTLWAVRKRRHRLGAAPPPGWRVPPPAWPARRPAKGRT